MQIKNLIQQYIYWPEVENIYQKNIDFSQAKVSDLNSLFEKEMQANKVSIEDIIIRFYALNEVLAKLRQQENNLLDNKALELYKQYVNEVEESSKKLFTYIFFISLIEVRHCHDLKNLDMTNSMQTVDDSKVYKYRKGLQEKFFPIQKKNTEKLGKAVKSIDSLVENQSLIEETIKNKKKAQSHYVRVQERINSYIERLVDIYIIELENTRENRIQEESQIKFDEAMLKFTQQDGNGEYISHEKLSKFLQIGKILPNITSNGRSAIHENLMPYLKQEDLKDLTIEDVLKCVVNIFKFGDFNHEYGGQPWANIAEHGLNFVRGRMNAEVFLDQAFSLEHNNGNMFNKNIVFKNSERKSWHSYRIYPDDPSMNEHDVYNINTCQFLLNAQHQGQLLSLLSLNRTILKNKIETEPLTTSYEQYQKYGLLPAYLKKSEVTMIDYYISENLLNIQRIIEDFNFSNTDFHKNITNVKVDIPKFNIPSILDKCRLRNKKTLQITENEILLHLTNDQLHKYFKNQNEQLIIEDKKEYIYSFEYLDTKNVPLDKLNKEFLGNKALGIAQMHNMNLSVPKALVFPAINATTYFKEKDNWLNDLDIQLKKIKNYFTDSQGNPIACSVRSGSSISMPGMMDTILNVGIDDSNYDYFCEKMGQNVTNECAIKFMKLFTKSLFNEDIKFSTDISKALKQFRKVLVENSIDHNKNIFFNKSYFPLSASQQYKWCLQAVFKSWHSERATVYRNHHGISHDIGTAAIVQQMVFGNLNENSCTGVVFSRDCISGDKGIIGEFLPKAQGEDVVSGAVTPKNIKELKEFNPIVYNELVAICERLEKDTGDVQDIEFTVEDSKLYILQKRKAVCSPMAQLKLSQELFESGLINESKLIESINIDNLIVKDIVDTGNTKPEIKGLVGNPGIMRGILIHSQEDMIKYADLYEQHKRDTNFGWIFYAPETSPDHAPIMLKTQGFITSNGGFTSHAAILSRSWDKPCIVGVGNEDNDLLKSGAIITMDANSGQIYKDVLPLKEGSKAEVANMVNLILDYHKVNIEELIKEGAANTHIAVLEVNNRKSWMEEYVNAVKLDNTTRKNANFLDLGHKIALMLVKIKEDNKKTVKEYVSCINPSLDEVENIKLEQAEKVENTNRVRMYF